MSAQIEYLDRPPAGWFALDVMKEQDRGPCWGALSLSLFGD
jgi:hypothetical protein